MAADLLRLDGRVAIVTGGARGQGEAESRLLHSRGATVVVVDVLDDLGEAVAADLGDRARYAHLDVSDADGWEELVRGVLDTEGRIDVLVNNAGIWATAFLEDETPEQFDRIIATNLRGPFLGMRAVIKPMRETGGGAIVNVASTASLRGLIAHGSYGASKWGLRGLGQVAAAELGASNIRINTVMPGAIDTPMVNMTEERKARMQHLPIPRVGSAAEVAELVAFLASDAASYLTGAEIAVDGGSVVGIPASRAMPTPT
jgi:3alpha(or 20beta)-hydroxysteroid dehydrogenase